MTTAIDLATFSDYKVADITLQSGVDANLTSLKAKGPH